jgi:hypothetical protein
MTDKNRTRGQLTRWIAYQLVHLYRSPLNKIRAVPSGSGRGNRSPCATASGPELVAGPVQKVEQTLGVTCVDLEVRSSTHHQTRPNTWYWQRRGWQPGDLHRFVTAATWRTRGRMRAIQRTCECDGEGCHVRRARDHIEKYEANLEAPCSCQLGAIDAAEHTCIELRSRTLHRSG